jgi:hypothetical protein
MNNRVARNCGFGFIVGVGTLSVLASASQAHMPTAPVKSDKGIIRVAQGCGPGGWRGPGGMCRYGGRCWRGAYGRLRCY